VLQPVDEGWTRLRAQVRAMLGARLASAADADDVAQDVLLKVLRGSASLRDEERFGGWVATTVRNAVTDHLRARQRHPLASPVAEEALETSPTEEDTDDVARKRVVEALRPFAQRLPAIYREAIILSELDEVPHAEIARRLHVSISGVKSRVQRGRALLRDMLDQCCEIATDARGGVVECVPRAGEAGAASDCCGDRTAGATRC
jgi:RNA polymerase sigma-70 factor (ECF subfamily)